MQKDFLTHLDVTSLIGLNLELMYKRECNRSLKANNFILNIISNVVTFPEVNVQRNWIN